MSINRITNQLNPTICAEQSVLRESDTGPAGLYVLSHIISTLTTARPPAVGPYTEIFAPSSLYHALYLRTTLALSLKSSNVSATDVLSTVQLHTVEL
jgi:hypothetical protein